MAEITWRNIDAPDFSQAGRLLEAGTRNLSDAFTTGQNLIGQQQQIDLANFENARKRNTAELQSQLLGFKTPEEMAAAQAQFSPEALKQRFGAAYDQAAINQMVAERPGQLRQDLTSQIQLGNLQQAEASEPYEQQFYALLAQNPKQAAQFLEQNKASFADTQKMYGDLANKQNQLDEMAFRRAQLSEMAAGRAEARADRQAAKSKEDNLNNFYQSLTEARLKNPTANLASLAVPLAKQFKINATTVNEAVGGVEQMVGTLGKPNPQQAAQIATAQTAVDEGIAQNDRLIDERIKSKLASVGITDTLSKARDDTTQTRDAVIDKWAKGFGGDIGYATDKYDEAVKSLGNDSPALVDHVLGKSFEGNYLWGTGTFNKALSQKGHISSVAQGVKKQLDNTKAWELKDKLETWKQQTSKDLRAEGESPIAAYSRLVPSINIAGAPDTGFKPVIPSYRKRMQNLDKLLGEATDVKATIDWMANPQSGYYNQR